MTVSMRVMSAGDGFAYLLRSVVTGDGPASQTSAPTRYYTEAGTPPGTWMGSGVAQFGDGQLQAGMTVAPEQLQALLGRGCDRGGQGRRRFERHPPPDFITGSSLQPTGPCPTTCTQRSTSDAN
ncbi:relaxase domain-containing protein [Georgenia yuyongxinii]